VHTHQKFLKDGTDMGLIHCFQGCDLDHPMKSKTLPFSTKVNAITCISVSKVDATMVKNAYTKYNNGNGDYVYYILLKKSLGWTR
jgi:hypothetical protein